MRLLVTGGYGFIGSRVVETALARGYEVFVLDARTPAAIHADRLYPLVVEISGDVADSLPWAKAQDFHSYAPFDAVVHLAAETHVDRSIGLDPTTLSEVDGSGPYRFLRSNVEGTARACTFASANGIPIVHMSTDEVYGDALDFSEERDEVEAGNVALLYAAKENFGFRPSSPYAASKVGAEAVVDSWRRTFGLDARVLRPSNAYGEGQTLDKLVTVAISKLVRGEPVPLYAGGKQIRQWVYVGDLAEAILLATESTIPFRALNLGGSEILRNIDLVERLATASADLGYPRPAPLSISVPDRPGHDFAYRVDSTLASEVLGWKPKTTFSEVAKSIVEDVIQRKL